MSATSNFVAMANQNAGNLGKILCPCKECRNVSHHSIESVYEHLVINGMDPTYTTWYHHGDHPNAIQKLREVEMSDAYNLYSAAYALDDEHVESLEERRDEEFAKSLEDVETPLYPGCLTYTELSAIVTLYKLKTDNGWADESFTGLLDKLHENAELENCPKCGSLRWKVDKRTKEIRKGILAKVLRYMPIIPRFQNMYRSLEMAENLKWHSTHGSNDGKMRHPVDSPTWKIINVDSPTWKIINDKWPSFLVDPRNLRLGLATDGFNPFSNLSSTYSCWPVTLVTYNLRPWLWMKRKNDLLTLLIPGPKQPGNYIDVYLQPLIEDLQELWSLGISVYDKSTDSIFNLRAILLWTMNDFPAL
ncbi:hypothetical protein Vadar_001845 [Vaccinium darrowii]|uniref:Uncharacterized protein n=1 Tax=Vaccinium darrowii TaxID=229202 RepID=A0ACB7YIH8_9ERIC|nr:hypothetical protein Vadar_001845 [Vaccinium darrowii]